MRETPRQRMALDIQHILAEVDPTRPDLIEHLKNLRRMHQPDGNGVVSRRHAQRVWDEVWRDCVSDWRRMQRWMGASGE